MTVYRLNKSLIRVAKKKYALYFSDSESLTKAVLLIFDKGKQTASSLYSFKNKYVLVTEIINPKNLMAINEFCFYKTNDNIKIEFIREYGKPLITNNAINCYAVAFLNIKEI